eukprot:scaffold215425_cov16-Prasinocladus_malaysianus.AAC.3
MPQYTARWYADAKVQHVCQYRGASGLSAMEGHRDTRTVSTFFPAQRRMQAQCRYRASAHGVRRQRPPPYRTAYPHLTRRPAVSCAPPKSWSWACHDLDQWGVINISDL